MRALVPALLAVGLASCGQPEDVLVIQGSVLDDFGAPLTAKLELYRDTGASELGCTTLSKWQELDADADGGFTLRHFRQETTGRFGLTRCLRLEWQRDDVTTSFSWLGRTRDTQLRPMPTWSRFPAPPLTLPTTSGGVTFPVPSLEVRDARGVIYRQSTLTASAESILSGPGAAPAFGSTLVARITQRGQQAQPNDLGQDPFLQFEYRAEARAEGFDGNAAHVELAHGKPCTVQQPTATVCALTDGLFTPNDLPLGTQSLDVLVAAPVRTVVVRGIGSRDRFAAVVLERVSPDGVEPAGRTAFDSALELLSTLEDPRQGGYVVVHWAGGPRSVDRFRVRLEDANGAPVDIGWVSEISVY